MFYVLLRLMYYSLAAKYGGLPAGEESGKRGYFLTFVIAYIRDFIMEYNYVAESFETAVPWSTALQVCKQVKFLRNFTEFSRLKKEWLKR